LDEKTASLQAMVDDLCDKRDSFAEQLDRCEIALAPHKTLPAEVLQHIFVLCADFSEERYPPFIDDCGRSWQLWLLYTFDNIPMPITLSHVCSSWRRVALATPSLWNDIN
ncbi:hypothetical protein AMATHDRAFT_95723, partial [Amanita thiersii Skay4041]